MLIELLPYYAPKLTAVGISYLRPGFAERLERAIAASERAKLIEGTVIESED
jgi:hypothetical protein